MAQPFSVLWIFYILLSYVNSSAVSISSPLENNAEARDTSCPDNATYTVPIGLEFDIYCDTEIGGSFNTTLASGASVSDTASDLVDCMEKCTTKQPACTAVEYNYTNSTCFYKNIDFITPGSSSTASADTHSAIALPGMLVPGNTSCPYDNGTLIETSNEAPFTVDCGIDIVGDDIASTSATYPYHADTLDECMDLCSNAQPLCYGVAWNADMTLGYANCYLKNPAPSPSNYFPYTYSVIHSATLNVSTMVPLNQTCPSGATYSSSGGAVFTLECNNWVSTGTNISSLHSSSFTSCMESCASSDSCASVIFDYSMTDGYNNCYLQSQRGIFLSSAYTHAAYISAYTNSTSNAPSSTSPSSISSSTSLTSSSSKSDVSWIAGPIIGGLAAIGLSGLGWWYWARRHKKKRATTTPSNLSEFVRESGSQIYFLQGEGKIELPANSMRCELRARPVSGA